MDGTKLLLGQHGVLLHGHPTGPCIPPGFTSATPYMTDGPCPTGYTEACATAAMFSGTTASSVTCCPSLSGAFVFGCHNEKYGCLATAKSGDIWTGTRSDIALTPNTQQPETHTAYSGEALWAWGIKFIRTPAATGNPTSTAKETGASTTGPVATRPTAAITSFDSTSPPRSTASESAAVQSTSSQISPGATAGIGIGATAGVIIIALVAWILYRKRHRRPAAQELDPQYHAPATYTYGPGQYDAQPAYRQSKAELGTGGERYMPAEMQ
ncbi:hypothetical protein PG996_012579 [Apiospora saccharicola]|uniref:Uncharacterized protein n=1 Tax=Apiospora saccharicola TaxID=335842 RepID=A0ABR1U2Z6_9PEZI